MKPRHLLLLLGAFLACSNVARAQEPLSFEKDVRPVLKAYCFDCHGGNEKVKGKLDLRLKRFLASGGKSGPAIKPGDPAHSLLIERMKSGEMPPGEKKVPADKIAVIEHWIKAGAIALRPEPEKLAPGFDITPDERAYWFYQPLKRPEPPKFAANDRVRTPVDAFVLAKLKEKGLAFNPDADRLTLLRRASFDLIGLPPTPQEVTAFLSDTSADAYEKLIDRLLASPHYGERWGRHWLDVVGYADSDGDGTSDTVRPYAWRYRDYVLRAFNADKPFNDFIVEQLAGDELVPQPWNNLSLEQTERLTATGFLRTAPDASRAGPAEVEQVVGDTIKIVSASLLGLTVGCAQCHDHRYDPIPQADYFRMRAVFEPALNPAQWRGVAQRRVSLYTDADRAKAAAIDTEAGKLQGEHTAKQQVEVRKAFDKELTKFPAEQRDALRAAFDAPADKRNDAQKKMVALNPKLNITPGVLYQYDQPAADALKKLQDQVNAKRAEKRVEEFIDVLNEIPGQVPTTKRFHRGDYRQPTDAMLPGDLTIAAADGKRLDIPAKDVKLPTTGRRLAYAKHLVSGEHPLVGRVLVNRLWLHHFGRGIVDTPGDFGILGQRPSHPELLDWLAVDFAQGGWSMKRMHKLLMTSTVYRQSSTRNAVQDKVDTSNALHGRFGVRRLDAEALRDRMLVTNGRLDRTPFGPPVAIVEDAVGQVVTPDDKPRRGVYLQARRTKPVAFLGSFDAPTGELNCDKRIASTGAPQALMLMNSDFILQQAVHFAKRLRADTPADFEKATLAALIAKHPRSLDAWQYGFGAYDAASRKTATFTPLPHFAGSAWQGSAALPDPKIGWVILHAAGGHAGDNPQHAAMRRWTAPRDGALSITGKLKHPSPSGDGVRGRIVVSRLGPQGEWIVKTKDAVTDVKSLVLKAGDTVDFIVDCIENVNSDSFEWGVQLDLAGADGSKESWNSARDFRGPVTSLASLPQLVAHAWRMAYQRPATSDEIDLACRFVQRQTTAFRAANNPDAELAALANLCQQLLSSNEFLYVD